MSRCRFLASWFLMALLWLAFPAHAAPAPIVFDFEDGLQGWELHGSAERVQMQVLGGEWAIFGNGFIEDGTFIAREIDLTGIASVSIERIILNEASIEFILGIDLITGALFVRPILGPFLDPNLWSRDLSGFSGLREFRISWGATPSPGELTAMFAFIDNITFHPVPEPSSWLLLGLGIAGGVMIRRKLASRA